MSYRSPQDRLDYLLEYGEDHLNEWEQEFIDSISIQMSDGKELSWKQVKKLIAIHKRIEGIVG